MRYRLTMIVETSRIMRGSDEFLLCTAQRTGLKRRMAKAKVISQTVTPARRKKQGKGK